MGFDKLLLFRVDGIPSKLGHYVVHKFNQEKMMIRVPGGKIKINSEVIYKLLGAGEEGGGKVTPDENLHEGVISWRRQYPGRFVTPTQLVDSIENSEDGDSFYFRMDFIMLFLTIMTGVINKEKNKLENTLDLMYEKHREKPTWPAKKTDAVKEATEIIDSVLQGLNVEEYCEKKRDLEEPTDEATTSGENISEEVLGKLEWRTDKKENQDVDVQFVAIGNEEMTIFGRSIEYMYDN
ncbi:hypothetical protein L1987_55196 [Smallanthus sonchifolius]|uniref:Uncharacterized protein n=1 Tax=Smallanthus sonchifolius TaxID=185202 RepID=A0ACB9E8Z1_9ASTR|nr:hypothetical protein L1987_55196 [Smallanthus sonchifolius]